MANSATGTAGPDGICFGPNGSGKVYVSMFVHRGGNPRKSQWLASVTPTTEYEVFCRADSQDWRDSAHNYWGVLDAEASSLGTRGERLAKFLRNEVETAAWHGYPVSPASGSAGDTPEDVLVESWISAGSVAVGRKIQRRRI